MSNFSRVCSLGFILIVSRSILEGQCYSKCSDWVMTIGEVMSRVKCVCISQCVCITDLESHKEPISKFCTFTQNFKFTCPG